MNIPVVKNIARHTGLILLGLLVAFFVVEIFVRVFFPQERRLFIADPEGKIRTMHVPNVDTEKKTDEYSARIKTNAQGFVGNDFMTNKLAGTFRIATLGDSFTEAFQVDYDKSYSALLEKKLNEKNGRGTPYQVYNFGMSSTGTEMQLLTYKNYIRQYKPDLLILQYYAGNDVTDDLLLHNDPLGGDMYQGIKFGKLRAFLSNKLHSPRFIIRRIERIRAVKNALARYNISARGAGFYDKPDKYPSLYDIYKKSNEPPFSGAFQTNCKTIKDFQAVTQNDGVSLLFLIIPHRLELFPEDWQEILTEYPKMRREKWDIQKPLVKVRQCLNETGIKYIDMHQNFKNLLASGVPRMYYKQDDHFDINGHNFVADYLVKKVLINK